MSAFSPVAIIYDSNGKEVSIEAGTAIPANTPGLLIVGSDGTNARFLRMATDGTLRIDPTGTTPQPVTDNGGSLTVDDGGLSLTVDGNVNIGNFPGLQNVNVTQIGSTAVSVGSGVTNAGTLRVVLPTDQTVIPVSDNSGSLTTDTPQLPGALVGGRLDTNIGAWLGSTAPTVGQKGAVNSIPVVLASDQTVIPVSDNGGSLTVDDGGLSLSVDDSGGSLTTDTPQLPSALVGGRLDVNLGSWLGSIAPTVGQKAMANSVPVAMASDQSSISVTFAQANARSGVRSCYRTLGGGTAGSLQILYSTPYTEPTSAAQRSLVSSSADDSAAGIGARTVSITYYDNTGGGPFTEIVTLNGTTPVNTVATNIRFIEQMEVLTAGSTGHNSGTISLYTGTGGAGTVIGSIGVGTVFSGLGDNATYWAHHYVSAGWTVELAAFFVSVQAGGSATTGRFFLTRSQPLVPNNVEVIVDGVVLVQGEFARQYKFTSKVAGFAKILTYGIPTVNNAQLSASFDFSESPTP